MSDLLYQSSKNKPDGTRCKKVIRDFSFTVIMLVINQVERFLFSFQGQKCCGWTDKNDFAGNEFLGNTNSTVDINGEDILPEVNRKYIYSAVSRDFHALFKFLIHVVLISIQQRIPVLLVNLIILDVR